MTCWELYPILAVNFYAPWCYWSKRLKPSWEKAAKTMRERYDPEMDGRILLAKVDCTEEVELCRRMTYNKPKHVYGSKLNNQSKCQIGTWKQ
ncbi:protein disulfide isomerase-like 5-4 isoform X2 [Citrus clementina]|uniref:protein disulfide isomerase-like 5-4 isoform X2 n=1 Tax=Citrus clementina TaxID=85681 RepID=UPI000CECF9BE|nr:protein disulfide isomerase-like 5-4 isoform X2 [Citrus x clementina]